MKYPKISVITVCYNMENYIEQTVLSVITQKYPNLEYIVVDGGSNDNTLKILNRFKKEITMIISEPDNGMYDAINKGISISTGEIVCWLNADDIYFPWTLQKVGEVFSSFSEIQWLCGIPSYLDEDGILTNIYSHPSSKPSKYIKNGWFRNDVFGFLQQESMFWRRELYFKSKGLDPKYKYAGDFKLWMDFAQYSELTTFNIPLAAFRKRKSSISNTQWRNYEKEIKHAIQNKKVYPNIFWRFSKNHIIKHLFRKLTFSRSNLIFYSIQSNKFRLSKIYRSTSSNSFFELLLEKT